MQRDEKETSAIQTEVGVMMNLIIIFAVIILACISLGIVIVSHLELFSLHDLYSFSPDQGCRSNTFCTWVITNCCPENAGAKWECVNKNKFVEPECPDNLICPQMLSPMPTEKCRCVEEECVSE